MAAIPGVAPPKFYENQWIVEAIATVPAVLGAIASAYLNLADRDPTKHNVGLISGAVAGWLSVAGVIKVLNALAKDKAQRQTKNPEGLFAAAHLVHSLVKSSCAEAEVPYGMLRVTIHRVVEPIDKPEDLEQIIPYIGGAGGGAGRRFSVRSGIIGKAVRERTPYAASRDSDDYSAFVKELVTGWSYTEDDARKLSPDRFSWMAVPILSQKNEAIGVVFLDATKREFFTSSVKEVAINACDGISFYLSEKEK